MSSPNGHSPAMPRSPTDGAPHGLNQLAINDIATGVESLSDGLDRVQKALHSNPEIAWQEFYAHDTCCKYMEDLGDWKVQRRAYGLETAWEAFWEYGQGGRVVGFISEMDALKGLGHACGHNLIAVVGMAAAIATAKYLEAHRIPGKVILLGTPAEEGGQGKVHLLKRGAFEGMNICLMAHPGGRGTGATVLSMPCTAAISATFHGRSSHIITPERGINALDAAVFAYTSISMLRQHVSPLERISCTIQGSEGWSEDVIPGESRVVVGIRSPSAKRAMPLFQKVANCLEAAGLATGCSSEVRQDHTYLDLRNADALADYFEEVCNQGWNDEPYGCKRAATGASTGFGSVSYRLPALQAGFDLPDVAPGDNPHSMTYAQCTHLPSSHRAAMRVATALAIVGARFAKDGDWAEGVRQRWDQSMADMNAPSTLEQVDQMDHAYPSPPLSV